MTTFHELKPSDPAAAALIRPTFPEAMKLRSVCLWVYDQGGMNLTSYWSGGSRDYHAVIDLATMKTMPVPENGSGFTAVDKACGPAGLPVSLPAPGFAVVTLTRSGSRKFVKIAIHRDNAAKLIGETK